MHLDAGVSSYDHGEVEVYSVSFGRFSSEKIACWPTFGLVKFQAAMSTLGYETRESGIEVSGSTGALVHARR